MTAPGFLAFLWVAGPFLLLLITGAAVWIIFRELRRNRAVIIVWSVMLSLTVISGLLMQGIFWKAPESRPSDPVVLVFEPGTILHEIAWELQEAEVIDSARALVVVARLTRTDRAFQAGRFHFPGGQDNLEVLRTLTNGTTASEFVTIPEGLRAHDVAGIIAREADVDSTRFMALITDSLFIAEVLSADGDGFRPSTLDGYLLPETYNIWYRMPAEEVASLMVGQFLELWTTDLSEPAAALGLTRHEVATFASIIEREAASAAERPLISAVFHNRLERGMRLESCATVLYALGRYKRRLYQRDLEVDSPYNTYRNRGLPPGPIANAGAASLRAVVSPAETNYLYFVARGDGTHTFSRTYADHLRAARSQGDGILVGGRAPPPGAR
ncbi:endolytic transglycosylase MltG [Gemmatimonadota bacterium]